MTYEIPSFKELQKLASDNYITNRYDGIFSSFAEIPQSNYNFILMLNYTGDGKFDGEWVKVNGQWERPDGSVPPHARAFSSGRLHP